MVPLESQGSGVEGVLKEVRQAGVLDQGRHDVLLCVEINQCVGCTRQFFTKSFLDDDAAVQTPSSRRRVDGVEDEAAMQHECTVKF